MMPGKGLRVVLEEGDVEQVVLVFDKMNITFQIKNFNNLPSVIFLASLRVQASESHSLLVHK